MHSYAALLGRHTTLSRAELTALLPDLIPGKSFGDFFTFQTARELDQTFLSRLGGTILLMRRLISDSAMTIDDLPAILMTELRETAKKPVFSLRLFGLPPRRSQDLLKLCKQHLKKHGTPSRYVGSEREPPKAIQLHDEGLLNPKQGCELTVLLDKEDLWIGRTIAAQDVKAYTERDIGKPVRDTTVGLLPPKLAQTLINFGEYLAGSSDKRKAESDKQKVESGKLTVFDPFCGTGVIPLESMLRGYDVLASDLSLKAVNGCSKNIEWARKTYKIAKKDVETTVWKQDAQKPFALKNPPTIIVTEGTLGPPLLGRPTQKDTEKYMRQVETVIIGFLRNCKATLPGVPVVMTIPVWYAQKHMLFLTKVWDVMHELGYRPTLPPHISPSSDGRFSILYRRNDQFVGREIVLLQPKK